MNKTQEYLGIEGGGTRTVAVVSDPQGRLLRRAEFGTGNIRLLLDKDLKALVNQLAAFCPNPVAVGVGMAGVRDERDRVRIQKAIEDNWGRIPSLVTNDLEIALAAASAPEDLSAQVLVLSGTGSCCFGRSAQRSVKVGGWGHLLGDRGSGYDIALSALKEVVFHFDRHGKHGPLCGHLLRTLALNEPDDLIAWLQNAAKADVAALAHCVFERSKDPIARTILNKAADSLANDAVICAKRLASQSKPVSFVLAGSVILKQPAFARAIALRIRKLWRTANIFPLAREGAWGAIELAKNAAHSSTLKLSAGSTNIEKLRGGYYFPEFDPATSPTEQQNPASTHFHELSTGKMIDVMLGAEKNVIPAILRERARIVRAVEMAAKTLKGGGRIFYVGAGTSGRLGVLDASECPPTFRASPEMIQGIIAGGQRALWQAVEGAEDNAESGASALQFRNLTSRDLVIGIAASGRTPFVWGALGLAHTLGARTILLCFNPSLKVAQQHRPDVVIAPNLGPEILTGSTRLKCGTATKLILNMISTIAMVRLGKVIGNLMVDLNPSNLKLRDRAVRIVQELTGCPRDRAVAALEGNAWVVKDAWAELKRRRN